MRFYVHSQLGPARCGLHTVAALLAPNHTARNWSMIWILVQLLVLILILIGCSKDGNLVVRVLLLELTLETL